MKAERVVLLPDELKRPENAGMMQIVEQQVKELLEKIGPGSAKPTGERGLMAVLKASQNR